MSTSLNLFVHSRNLDHLEAYSQIGLGIHGAALLVTQGGESWQWLLVIITAITGVVGLVGPRRQQIVPRLIRNIFILIAGWALMLSTGGMGSFFFFWYIILAVITSLVMLPPFSWGFPVLITGAYLLLWPFSPSQTIPLLIILTRSFLLLFLGWLSARSSAILRDRAAQEPVSQRSHALLIALDQISAQLHSVPKLEDLYTTLGQELKKLGLTSFVALRDAEDAPLQIKYLSIHLGLLSAAEKLVGVRAKDINLSDNDFSLTKTLLQTHRPQITTDLLRLAQEAIPRVPVQLLKLALRLVGLSEEAALIYLPLIVEDRLLGVKAVWGETLTEEDLPVFELFAGQISAALHMNMLYERLVASKEQEQDILLQFSQQLISLPDRQAVLELAAKTTQPALQADLVSLMLLDSSGKFLVLRNGIGWNPALINKYRVEVTTSREGHAVRTGKPVQQEDVLSGKPFPCPVELAEHGVRSSIAAPLLGNERTLGTLCVHSKTPRRFSSAEIRLLSALAAETALALENTIHLENLGYLYRLTLDITRATNVQETIALVSRAAAQAFETPYALVAKYDPDTNTVNGLSPAFGMTDEEALAFSYPVTEELYALWDVEKTPSLAINDLNTAPEALRALARPFNIQAMLAARILLTEQPFHVLFLGHPQPGRFSSQDILRAEAYGQVTALTLERIQQTAALQANQARLQAVLDSAPEGIIIIDAQHTITTFTPTAERIFGYSAEDIIGQPINILLPERLVAPHRDHIHRFAKSEDTARLMGDRSNLNIFGRRKDGREFPVEVSIARFSIEGQMFFTAMVKDITARQAAAAERQRLFSAVEQTTDGVLVTDREGTIRYANPAIATLSGFSENELLGNNPRIFKSGQHGQEDYHHLWETVLSGKVYRSRFSNRHKEGHLFCVDQTIAPVRDTQGEITHFVSIWKDITVQVAQEREIADHAQRMAELATVSASLTQPYTEIDVITAIGEGTQRLCGAPGVAVYLPAADDEAECAWSCGVSQEYIDSVLRGFRVMPGFVLTTTTEPILIENVAALPRESPLRELALSEGIRSVELWPLVYQERTIAALACYRPEEFSCTEAEREVMGTFTRQAAIALVNARSYDSAQRRLERLGSLHAIDQAITADLDLTSVLDIVLAELSQRLQFNAAAVLLWNPEEEILEYAAGHGFRTGALKHTRLPMGAGHAGKAAQQKGLVYVLGLQERVGEFVRAPLLQDEDFYTYFGMPLIVEDEVVGVMELFHRDSFVPDEEWIEYLKMLSYQAAIAVHNAALFNDMRQAQHELEEAYEKTLAGWVQALDLRDEETRNHTQRVTQLTLQLAQQLGFKGKALEHVRRGALLHDIGKMGVPDDVLLKPGKLTDEEWVIMRQHPVYAYQFLSEIEYLRPALQIPYCHHERWDGSGYPQGLKGEEIPMEARIFAVIDVWDALSSDRPYRKAWPPERVKAYLEDNKGIQFDPQVVEVFIREIFATGKY